MTALYIQMFAFKTQHNHYSRSATAANEMQNYVQCLQLFLRCSQFNEILHNKSIPCHPTNEQGNNLSHMQSCTSLDGLASIVRVLTSAGSIFCASPELGCNL